MVSLRSTPRGNAGDASNPGRSRSSPGTENWPSDLWRYSAAVFTIWSRASRLELIVLWTLHRSSPPREGGTSRPSANVQGVSRYKGRVISLGIVGTGRLGGVLARLARDAGFEVRTVSSSDSPAALADAASSDVVVLALPLRRLRELDPAPFAGRVVVDAMNHVPLWDGPAPDVETAPSSSEYVQGYLRCARLVKTLNHLGADELDDDAAPSGTPGRRAVGVAGDDAEAVRTVMALVERLGFDAVPAGPLAAGVLLEPRSDVFNGLYDRDEMAALFQRSR